MSATEIAIQNRLGPICISLLRIQTGPAHMRHHRITSSVGVLGVSEWVVLGCGLWEPDVAAVAAEVAGGQSGRDVFFYYYRAAGCIDEPGACDQQTLVT